LRENVKGYSLEVLTHFEKQRRGEWLWLLAANQSLKKLKSKFSKMKPEETDEAIYT
jgi:hypothetical protein